MTVRFRLIASLAAPALLAVSAPLAHAQQAQPAGAPAPDAARLAAARTTVDAIFPAGTYMKMMNGALVGMMDQMVGTMGQMPIREIAQLGGAKPAEIAALDKATLADITRIVDPVYEQRMKTLMHVMMPELANVMGQAEPGMRDGLAEAYARRFSLAELAEMNHFFASPTGKAYAANAMLMQMDPAVMSRMQQVMPMISQAMPGIMKKAIDATASLPKPRKFSEMSPDERTRLASLLGVPEAKLAAQEQANAK